MAELPINNLTGLVQYTYDLRNTGLFLTESDLIDQIHRHPQRFVLFNHHRFTAKAMCLLYAAPRAWSVHVGIQTTQYSGCLMCGLYCRLWTVGRLSTADVTPT